MSTSPVDQAMEVLGRVLKDAQEARGWLTADMLGSSTDSPQTLFENLAKARHVVDRLESLLCQAVLLKAQAERYRASCQAAVEDAEVEQIGPTRANDYTSARDRGIEINTKTIGPRRVLRQAAMLYTEAVASVTVIQTMHRGADSHRRDIETKLRAITLTTSLER